LLQISVTASDPRIAQLIADEVARQLTLQTPSANDQEQEARRDFARQQLGELQQRINETQDEIKSLEERLAWQSSARGVQDLQGQIAAARQKVQGWQSTYAGLLQAVSGGRTNNLTVVEPAIASSRPISPNVPRNLFVAASVGLLLAAGAALLIEYLDDTISSAEAAEQLLGLPALGFIGRLPRQRRPADRLVVMRDAGTPTAEAYRLLRANLQGTSKGGDRSALLVTSTVPGEGKTTTACNLAIALAQGGKRVVLCDGDLRRPTVHRLFDLANVIGLSTLLCDEDVRVEAALQDVPVAGLKVLTSGPALPSPADALGSAAMRRRLDQLRTMADVVVMDAPAALAVADAVVLGTVCTDVLLIVDARRTRREVAREGVATFEQAGVGILGVVLNRARDRSVGYRGYYAHRGADEREGPSSPGFGSANQRPQGGSSHVPPARAEAGSAQA
jgi:non-specific protein-tyrosine kinase